MNSVAVYRCPTGRPLMLTTKACPAPNCNDGSTATRTSKTAVLATTLPLFSGETTLNKRYPTTAASGFGLSGAGALASGAALLASLDALVFLGGATIVSAAKRASSSAQLSTPLARSKKLIANRAANYSTKLP